jgi:hypothetical protein
MLDLLAISIAAITAAACLITIIKLAKKYNEKND